MTLADLIDLEAELARERGMDPAALEARDRALVGDGPGIAVASARGRDALIRRWLAALRGTDPTRPSPGRTVASALAALRAVLVIGGLALGWGAAAAVLRYSGAQPVDVWDFLLVFVALQIVLFALVVASFLFPVASLGIPLLGVFRAALAAIYPWLAERIGRRSEERVAGWRTFWHRLRSRRSLYRGVEPWILIGLTQAFGLAFNVGALLGCLRLIVFSDLAFAWGTTLLGLDPARFHAVVHALAVPFAWIWPGADPSRELVDITQYSRLDAAYLASGVRRSVHPELVGGWWPFLVASLVCYGLVPRAAMLAAAALRARWILAALPLDDAEVTRLVRRLSEPHVETRGPAEEPAVRASAGAPRGGAAEPFAGTRCAVVLWRDVPRGPELDATVARQTRCSVEAVQAAGGRDYEEGRLDWRGLVEGADAVVVVAEAWEAPDKAVLRLCRRLREELGPRRHVAVLLVDGRGGRLRPASAGDLAVWRDVLVTLEDPYVAAAPLQVAP